MAHIPKLNDYNDIKRATADGDLIRIENKDGDTMLFTPYEAKYIMKEYMSTELSMFSQQQITTHKDDLKHKFNEAFTMFNEEMNTLINKRVNEVSEKVIHQLVDYKIEEEVKKRVEAKLNKIKEQL